MRKGWTAVAAVVVVLGSLLLMGWCAGQNTAQAGPATCEDVKGWLGLAAVVALAWAARWVWRRLRRLVRGSE